jgi:hypothetical protein
VSHKDAESEDEAPLSDQVIETRDNQMRRLSRMLEQLYRARTRHSPPVAVSLKLQLTYAELAVHDSLEKLRSASEKATPPGILVTEEQVARILAAIRDT